MNIRFNKIVWPLIGMLAIGTLVAVCHADEVAPAPPEIVVPTVPAAVPDSPAVDNMHVDLPYGIGSLQLPWKATEVVYGAMRPIKGGLWHQIAGVSLPILTLGKLSDGYRIIDGSLGAVGAWPVETDPVDIYGAFGHDIIQDIPFVKDFKSAHFNVGISYSNALTGWCWGPTLSYAFGGQS